MKLASFRRGGQDSYGVVRDGDVVDIGARHGDGLGTLKSVLAAGALGDVRGLAVHAADATVEEITFLPVIPDPQKLICVGLNYAGHVKETGRPPPDYPALFPRYADAQVGHNQPIVRPRASTRFDWEGELAFVIGTGGRHIAEADALSHIAGYTCVNDGSIRDWQRHTSQFMPGKNFWHSGACGPWMVTADEIPDPSKLTLTTRVNGEEMQRTSTDDLIFDVPQLVAYISTFTPLSPGDIVSTGTPSGVGAFRDPPVFMKAGDVVEVEITGIGVLRNTVVDE